MVSGIRPASWPPLVFVWYQVTDDVPIELVTVHAADHHAARSGPRISTTCECLRPTAFRGGKGQGT